MKRILSLLVLVLLFVSAAEAKFTYLRYYGGTLNGYGTAVAGKGAIYVPAEFAKCYVGKKVTGVRVGLSANTDELSVFLTRSLEEAPLLTKAAEFASSGNNLVKFDTPYEITGEAFYVGYEFKGVTAAMGVSDCYNPNGNWTDLGTGWVNNAANAADPAKALAIAIRVEGDVLPMDAALTGVNNVAVRSGNSFQMPGRILNLSPEKITKVRVAYSVNGEEEKFADIEQTIGERGEAEISVEHDAIVGSDPIPYTMRIVSVNGETDAYEANNSQSAYVLFPNTEAVKRVVMEEFTGIKCGFCPRGIVGIRTCHERFGDKFIAIAKHCYTNTPTELQSPTYNYVISGGFPKCIIDRRYQCDPGPTKAPPYVSAQLGAGCSAGVELEAVFPEDGDGSQIDVRATAQFLSSYNNSQFRFAFAILEDSVKGYEQANNFYGKSTQMGGFEKLPSHAAINLDHVARAGFGVLNGIENSIPANVDEFHTVTYATKLDIPSNVQSKDYLRVVVLLLDTSTGRIDNAAEVAYVKTGSLSAIRDLKADSPAPDVEIRNGKVVADGFDGTIQVYSVNGMRLANESLAHGIYIVRLTNGKQTFVKRIAY